jgi:GntR family transcriptional repressor for pyruvate dehydrogenase complex
VDDLFAPLDDQPAYRQIANLIEQRIVARSLRTGDPLPSETDLARQFGVNRSTIREAIRELEVHGLLGRGRGEKRLRVTRPEPRDISSGVSRALALHDVTFLELWEAMMALEPAAAHHAAARRTDAQLQALVRAGARFTKSIGHGYELQNV